MNYCSIDDAWGRPDNISNTYKQYMKDTIEPSLKNKQVIETFVEPKIQHTINYTHTNNHNDHTDHDHVNEIHDCNSFLNHIKNCRKCHNRIRNQFKPQLIEKFQDVIDDNKDTIVLILIGISILLFFNLINNLTK